MRYNSRLHRYGVLAKPSKPSFCCSRSNYRRVQERLTPSAEQGGSTLSARKHKASGLNRQFCSFDAFVRVTPFGRKPFTPGELGRKIREMLPGERDEVSGAGTVLCSDECAGRSPGYAACGGSRKHHKESKQSAGRARPGVAQQI